MPKINKPSFYFGYHRPWNKNFNWYESWLDYNRDNQRSEYVSQMIVSGIKEVNAENINCLSEINSTLSSGFQSLQSELKSIDDSLFFINSTLEEGFYDLKQNQIKQIQLTVATNILLVDIKTLISFSDSEKERYESIREGLKFIANVQRDEDYFDDAFRLFSKAIELKPTDYFSFFFLGYVSLFSEKHFDPNKAIEFFKKTLKYALIDDNNDIKLLNDFYSKVDDGVSGINLINSTYLLLAQSYYLIGDFDNALKSSLSVSEDSFSNNFTIQLKYAARVNDERNIMIISDKIFNNYLTNYEEVFTEIDIINSLFTLNYLKKSITNIETSFLKLKAKCNYHEDNFEIIKKLKGLLKKSLSVIEKKKVIDTYNENIIDFEISKQIDFEKYVKEELSKIESIYSEYLEVKKNHNSTKGQIQSKINALTESRNNIQDYFNYVMIGYIILSILVIVYIFLKNESVATAIGQNIVVVIVEVIVGVVLRVMFTLFGAALERILEYRISKKRKIENKIIYHSKTNRKTLVENINELKKNLEYHLQENIRYDYAKVYVDRLKSIRC